MNDDSPGGGNDTMGSKGKSFFLKSKSPKKESGHKKNKSISGAKKELARGLLMTPTSLSMINSFIVKNADPSFETYYKTMNKRKIMNSTLLD